MTAKYLPFLYPPPPAPSPIEDAGLLPYDSKEFGLTYDEYQDLLDNIEQAIEEGNRKYGYGGAGYLAEDGNYYLPSPTNTFVDHTKVKTKTKTKK
jgi:hypothetical protein